MYTIESEVTLPAPLAEVFPFFSNARNLERLTPGFLNFRVLTPEPIEVRHGTLIDYKLRIRSIPIRWQSEITAWEPPLRFVDEQRRGPNKTWVHEHTFVQQQDGTTMARDHVRYYHVGGGLVNRLLVGPDLRRIFAYRRRVLLEIFTGTRAPAVLQSAS